MFEIGAGYVLDSTVEAEHFSLSRLENAVGARIARRSLTVWQEHCSECAMPSCYATCAYYRPRLDYKCRRLDGGLRIGAQEGHLAVPVKVKFGRWARLLGYGPTPLLDLVAARQRESTAISRERASEGPLLRGLAAPIRRRLTNRMSRTSSWGAVRSTNLFMVIECQNASPQEARLVFSVGILADDAHPSGSETFKQLVTFGTGYSVQTVPVSSFIPPESLGKRFAMELSPAGEDQHPELTFGLIDIVELIPPFPTVQGGASAALASGELPKLKCVVWDLDNTLWSGILVEDGIDALTLNERCAAAIRDFDAKGILQSIASKNDAEDALAAVRRFGLEDYFLFPQISWRPKSEGLRLLSQRLNIGSDSFALVDDQRFERAEVEAAFPEVLTVDPEELSAFIHNPRLDIPITAEASQRRLLYRAEGLRDEARVGFGGEYEEFLKSCGMTAKISLLADGDQERVYELVQRTNQLNISTRRYTREELAALPKSESLRAFVVSAADRFGVYGLIGFAVFDLGRSVLVDMMFSCRVQGKLVDDAFIAWLGEANERRGAGSLSARFRGNKKNEPARQLLQRLGFEPGSAEEAFVVWTKTSLGRRLADIESVIRVEAPEGIV